MEAWDSFSVLNMTFWVWKHAASLLPLFLKEFEEECGTLSVTSVRYSNLRKNVPESCGLTGSTMGWRKHPPNLYECLSCSWKIRCECSQSGSSAWWLFTKIQLRILGSLHLVSPLPSWRPFLPVVQSGWVVSGRWERQWKIEVHFGHFVARPPKTLWLSSTFNPRSQWWGPIRM